MTDLDRRQEEKGANSAELEVLRKLVVDLIVRWQMFNELFSDAENDKVFKRTGSGFWILTKRNFFEGLIMSISRFFDPAIQNRRGNLSLAAVIEWDEVSSIRTDLEERLDQMKPVFDRGIKKWRKWKHAHSDLLTAVGQEPLPNVPLSDVETLVTGISEFSSQIDLCVYRVSGGDDISIRGPASQVLRYLKAGIAQTDIDRERKRKLGGE